jgi:hypothetical protein
LLKKLRKRKDKLTTKEDTTVERVFRNLLREMKFVEHLENDPI